MMASLQMSDEVTLLDVLAGLQVDGSLTSLSLAGVALDSREVAPGYLFFALAGERSHGLDFIDAVIAAGAVAVLVDSDDARFDGTLRARLERAGICVLGVAELARQVGVIASRFYAEPSRELQLVGVTGTDGKTSVSQFVAQALHGLQRRTAVVGTLGSGLIGALGTPDLTTPDAVTLQKKLREFCAQGAEFAALEVSSHAQAQGRVAGVAFDIAVLTNLGRDHIDYHGTLASYHAAKWRLLNTPGLRAAVVNSGDPAVRERLQENVPKNLVRYSSQAEQCGSADVWAEDIALSSAGIEMTIVTDGQRWPLRSKLIGRFNIDNLLAAFCVLRILNFAIAEIIMQLEKMRPVAGRAECFAVPAGGTAVVDFAHTPQALEAILNSVRAHCTGELWCVFGCGGDRDAGKRPLMAGAAEKLADRVVVTDDNPRSEDGDAIVRDIVAGFAEPGAVQIERDRERAIRNTMDTAQPSDWVVVAGKGHEDYQIVGERRIHLSDREIVADCVLAAGHSGGGV